MAQGQFICYVSDARVSHERGVSMGKKSSKKKDKKKDKKKKK